MSVINESSASELRKRGSVGSKEETNKTNGKYKDPHLLEDTAEDEAEILAKKVVKVLWQLIDYVVDFVQYLLDLPGVLWIVLGAFLTGFINIICPHQRKCVDDDTILVTGAAAGLGQETVVQLAKISRKATYVLWDINEKGLEETKQKCLEQGAEKVYTYVVDLTKHEDVVQKAQEVRKEVGQVTILFNNAGLVQINSFLDMTPAMEEKIMLVNLMSYMWTIREFLPDMIESGKGHIVNTCSGLGHMRFRYLSAYVASKFGLRGFIDCLKLEMRIHPKKPDIRFSTVYPSFVKTNMTTGMTWKPRYKTWNVLQLLDVDYAAGRIVDGILKEREDIMVPRSIFFAKYFYGMIPDPLIDRMENLLFQDIEFTSSYINVPSAQSPRNISVVQTKMNDNTLGITMEPNPAETAIPIPSEDQTEQTDKTRL